MSGWYALTTICTWNDVGHFLPFFFTVNAYHFQNKEFNLAQMFTMLLLHIFLLRLHLRLRRPAVTHRFICQHCRIRRFSLQNRHKVRHSAPPSKMSADNVSGAVPTGSFVLPSQSSSLLRKNAKWDDYTHQIFLHCCEVMIAQGFRHGKCFTKPGWENLTKLFNSGSRKSMDSHPVEEPLV
ncbi:Uncharacterized protein Adt_02091 [Abeliophyllum distichum]|uniref:Uncharacterized protein n=1 Tax=Abeliophyllum distichum TaxID=126358 RepID=A0ABD1VX52_9LAMI